MINWKVRVKNKNFWLALIPAILIAVQMIAKLFGFELNVSALTANLIDVINAVFVVLAILGVVMDPTTAGISDSKLAMTYDEPKEDVR